MKEKKRCMNPFLGNIGADLVRVFGNTKKQALKNMFEKDKTVQEIKSFIVAFERIQNEG